jgi:hypothetical protein
VGKYYYSLLQLGIVESGSRSITRMEGFQRFTRRYYSGTYEPGSAPIALSESVVEGHRMSDSGLGSGLGLEQRLSV